MTPSEWHVPYLHLRFPEEAAAHAATAGGASYRFAPCAVRPEAWPDFRATLSQEAESEEACNDGIGDTGDVTLSSPPTTGVPVARLLSCAQDLV